MTLLLLVGQAALNLYQWDPAGGPVFGYHVYVNGELVQTVYENRAWIEIYPRDAVEVRAFDSDYRTGPFSAPSDLHAVPPSCALPEPAACHADVNEDGFVGLRDRNRVLEALGNSCTPCPLDVNRDGQVTRLDSRAVLAMDGQVCVLPGSPACLADVDGDGAVSSSDWVLVVPNWGLACTPCREDVDGDGQVTWADVTLVDRLTGQNCF